jgi:hypothetical protein
LGSLLRKIEQVEISFARFILTAQSNMAILLSPSMFQGVFFIVDTKLNCISHFNRIICLASCELIHVFK